MADANVQPLVLVNAVGLTSRLLALDPRLQAMADHGWVRPLREVVPAVTCTAQASLLTGKQPQEHGIVANGWLFRETQEVRFWQQSNHLLQAPPIYQTLRDDWLREGKEFRVAKLFWWFNQGAQVSQALTPKPHYGCDGNKAFGITGTPVGLAEEVERELGPFPFPTFWGPGAGKGCSEWIARSAATILQRHRPHLSLVYLPHLDYDPQRFGPAGCDMAQQVQELCNALEPLAQAAKAAGARLWLVSEYGHTNVDQPILLNRIFRQEGLLAVRNGPFGEMVDLFESRAFAVCDHQWAHIYVRERGDLNRVAERVAGTRGVAKVFVGQDRAEVGLDHPRSGEIVAASQPRAWFAYPYWLEDNLAPDFARTVDIHRKPGFDPCEMFFDPRIPLPKLRVVRKLVAKKLGFRMKMDVIPLDPSIVRGSHGLSAERPEDRPLLVGEGSPPSDDLRMTDVYGLLLDRLRPSSHSE